ncbi:MAG: hypothetical protein KAH18_04695 [Psychromonas sp.]|nr:hypothetical protein [Psychromonas sp.]
MNHYLTRAIRACDYVMNTVRIRTVNRDEGINLVSSLRNHMLERAQLGKIRSVITAQTNTPWDLNFIQKLADEVSRTQTGSCGEQTALAFNYLFSRGERGMAIMTIAGKHMFLLIGLKQRPPLSSVIFISAGSPDEWGEDAVICDPWYQEWFVAKDEWHRKVDCMIGLGHANTKPKSFTCEAECYFYLPICF